LIKTSPVVNVNPYSSSPTQWQIELVLAPGKPFQPRLRFYCSTIYQQAGKGCQGEGLVSDGGKKAYKIVTQTFRPSRQLLAPAS